MNDYYVISFIYTKDLIAARNYFLCFMIIFMNRTSLT